MTFRIGCAKNLRRSVQTSFTCRRTHLADIFFLRHTRRVCNVFAVNTPVVAADDDSADWTPRPSFRTQAANEFRKSGTRGRPMTAEEATATAAADSDFRRLRLCRCRPSWRPRPPAAAAAHPDGELQPSADGHSRRPPRNDHSYTPTARRPRLSRHCGDFRSSDQPPAWQKPTVEWRGRSVG